jgi:hypothetical protein
MKVRPSVAPLRWNRDHRMVAKRRRLMRVNHLRARRLTLSVFAARCRRPDAAELGKSWWCPVA